MCKISANGYESGGGGGGGLCVSACVCVHSVHMHAYTCVSPVLESADRMRLVTFPTLSLAATPAMWKCTHTVLSFRASHTSTRRSTDTFCT